ncbi:MAG: S41 family peptidase [Lentimicrobiaceae bacterium]|nr:S41 family peptidase [Lentimicrobiaceae bacterium]
MSKRTRMLLIIAAITIVTGFTCNFVRNDFELAKNLDIYANVMKQLNESYVDEINVTDLTKTGIDALLNKLDPYTVYYPESDLEEFKLMTTGQYGGIGSLIQKDEEYVVISDPYENLPAAKAGLQPGDKIVEIEGKNVKGKNVADVSTMLRGQPGTKIKLGVIPYGKTKIEYKEIVRQEIKLPSVSYFGMWKDNIGYIRLDQFTDHASQEVHSAFTKLKEEGMQNLIFDLRGNGGGLLSEAVNIVGLFVERGSLVVSTKGKQADKNQLFATMNQPIDTKIPIVVLVDGTSASASEIVSGALQDLDRAVVVGQRTFGKGLVQNVVPLSYNTNLKITVSKYYLPSGRCIQEVDYSDKDSVGHSAHKSDSLAVAFKTKGGRTVYDYGGVEPDVVEKIDSYSTVLLAMFERNMIFNFANEYKLTHETIASARDFAVTDAVYNDFLQFVKKGDLKYETLTERQLKNLKESVKADKFSEKIAEVISSLENAVAEEKLQDLTRYKKEISELLTMEIVSRYYSQKGRIEASLNIDQDMKKATELLKDTKTYSAILKGTYKN